MTKYIHTFELEFKLKLYSLHFVITLSPLFCIVKKYLNVHIYVFTDCPGTESDSAGKTAACQGCPNQSVCSALPKGPDPGMIIVVIMVWIELYFLCL